ncbi:MAG: NrpR regulatory domain-containing protein [bacterium]|jgi:repressor of nif and glnA expression|nr:NrpR regulatory domain-containing protein [bacterium]
MKKRRGTILLKDINPRQKVAILRILRDAREPIGSAIISGELKKYGFDLSGRTIRLYLQKMEDDGLVTSARRGRDGGRTITPEGVDEIHDALVTERVGFMASKLDELSYLVTFEPEKRQGEIVLNMTLIDAALRRKAVRCMIPVFEAGMGMGEYVAFIPEGETLGEYQIPEGKLGIGTICSVTLNGVLLQAGIPVISVFGGVLEIDQGVPARFTDIIHYGSTSLDPLEIFIKGKLTSVRDVAEKGFGRLGASFREIPSSSLDLFREVRQTMRDVKLEGILLMGKPSQSLLGFPVEEGRTGFVVAGGLNPVSAIEESGIPTINHALSALYDFNRLIHYTQMMDSVEQMK